MESLAERTERVLRHVEDWPLGVAMDYLIDAGFSVLGGVRIVGRGRVARLKLRLKAVAKEMVRHVLSDFLVTKYPACTRVFFWWFKEGLPIADALSVALLPSRKRIRVTRGWRVSYCYSLPQWCQASAEEFAERSLCDLFVLLWCIDRCYRRS